MTNRELEEMVSQWNCLYFTIDGTDYCMGYIPKVDAKGNMTFEEIGISEDKDDAQPSMFTTLAELLAGYVINGIPLQDNIENIKNMRGTPTA